MRTGGFPCRVLGCDRAFRVIDQSSMDALKAASTQRSDHEVSAHEYHHVRIAEAPSYTPFQRSRQKPANG